MITLAQDDLPKDTDAPYRYSLLHTFRFVASQHGGAHWVSVAPVRSSVRASLQREFLKIKAMGLPGAGFASLNGWFRRADRALELDEVPEFLRLLGMIESKVNRELAWRWEDENRLV
jgi:hypothetical protein